jgi:hypothetical protein
MRPDGSNAGTMVKWVLHNDKEARRIAKGATFFIYDVVYNLDSADDDRMVKEEIARR